MSLGNPLYKDAHNFSMCPYVGTSELLSPSGHAAPHGPSKGGWARRRHRTRTTIGAALKAGGGVQGLELVGRTSQDQERVFPTNTGTETRPTLCSASDRRTDPKVAPLQGNLSDRPPTEPLGS